MAAQKFEWILDRITQVEREDASRPDSASIQDDTDDLIEELFIHASRNIDFARLSNRLKERQTLDLSTLREAVVFFRGLSWGEPIVLTPELTVDPLQQVNTVGADIDRIESLLTADPAASAGLSLDLKVGGALLRLSMCALTAGYSLDPLIRLTKQKIDLLDPDQVVLLWSLLQREFDPERDVRMQAVPSILSDDFLSFEDDARAREKLARYIVDLKPRLMLALYGRNGSGFPIDLPSLPSVLTWKSASTADSPSMQEIRLAKAIRRIVGMSSKLFDRTPEEMAAVLHLDASSPVIKEPDTSAKSDKASVAAVCYELRKAAQLLSELSVAEADFPICIRRYKLGIEVMSPHLNKEFARKSEVFLQRELARFALERGFFVVGTRFGHGETDLVSWEKEALYIVETKLFRGPTRIRVRAITDAFAQLRAYMDTHPTTPRGLLVLYNMSPSHISAPEHWLRQRFLIVPINMQASSPSHRQHTLEVTEGDDEQTINVLQTGPNVGGRKVKRRIRSKRAKTRK